MRGFIIYMLYKFYTKSKVHTTVFFISFCGYEWQGQSETRHIHNGLFGPFNEEISIIKLCDLCMCSESTLFKSFQSTVGVSPIKYKHNIMIQTSLSLLSDSDLSIEEISRECGFSSSNYFRKIFKETTGTTPKKLKSHS